MALANVIVLVVVALAVQALVVVVDTVESLPLAAALLFLIAATFVLSAAYAEIVDPAVGFDIAEIEVPLCDAELAILVSNVAHCVAVTVNPWVTNPTVSV